MLKSSLTSDLIEAGVDEVGRGCLAGPVVAAAVILPKDYKSGILTDSKLLSAAKREVLTIEIKNVALAYAIAEVDNIEIDKINILNASFKAMTMAIKALQVTPEFLLIDGNKFPVYNDIKHKCIVKGDSKFLSIAAASVLAKTYRDNLMAKLNVEFPFYGWESNAGYATKKHREGIAEKGITSYHRKSFLKNFHQLKLDI